MRVLIIEDELPQAQQLQHYLAETEPSFEVMRIIPSVCEAAEYLSTNRVDLIFLDIQLSDGLCFEIFEKVNIQCPVIFTTAYDQYAIQAFKHNGIDYLLKPVSKIELEKSIGKFKSFTNTNVDYATLLNSIKSLADKTMTYKKRFVSQSGKKLRIITDTDIAYFYALGGSVFIRTRKNENCLIDETLENIEQELDPYNFFRLNRKIIAQVSAIKEMIPYSKSRLKIELTPEFDEDVIVSYKNIREFMKWIKK